MYTQACLESNVIASEALSLPKLVVRAVVDDFAYEMGHKTCRREIIQGGSRIISNTSANGLHMVYGVPW
jgi:hypothetical protein